MTAARRPRRRKGTTHAAHVALALERAEDARETVGEAKPAELQEAAAGDGATFVRASERARAHVRHAPPAEVKGEASPLGKVGRPTRVMVGAASGGIEELPGHYVLTEVAALVTSHDPRTFAERKDYPAGVQERRYHADKYEQLKVIRNAAQMVPAFLVSDNPDSVNGPPVVAPSGVVLGGNSRAMSLTLAYDSSAAASYRALLVERAKVFGFAPTDLDGMTAPALVRVVEAGAERWRDLSRKLNEAQTQEKDVNADAVSLSYRVSAETLAELAAHTEGDETLTAFLSSTRARGFVRRLVLDGVITQQASGRLLAGSELSEEGRNVVLRVLVATLLPDATLIERIGAARRELVARVAPALLRARKEGHDLAPALKAALEDVADADARGLSVAQLAAQSSMFADLTDTRARTPEAVALRDLLTGPAGRFVRVLRRFGTLARDNPAGQGTMFQPPASTADLLTAAIAAEKDPTP